ncbi:hypothetical protein D6T17_25440 [Salmonella enterica subsp. enterica serovar Oranienburg]|uniref:Uncharacterized protein n=1 Tax=Salmonella enterica subsp. enterica serovar Panama TaxID=29472 RepID=A0A5U8JDN2_SALET|nr:hypothetical protein [Salmonella enterica]EBR7996896.1 hypothetical protein [Salmonella enterica subsp. enterica serovar Panama]EBV1275378.1 hypothetical protein [Salmonella enterica subsp. enterica serovar Oranienburg]ASD87186.1 hypothetical protein LFZ16_13580 [Salmonella enterica subsp. enterica serovar India str. SA20085604]EBR8435675.1 hypothetical protein [Salmonella enterica subsp. enterica serovar Panama]EBW9463317.1 hypothetical protein [Salmonella enterica subsp. enterica serovar 
MFTPDKPTVINTGKSIGSVLRANCQIQQNPVPEAPAGRTVQSNVRHAPGRWLDSVRILTWRIRRQLVLLA